MGGGQMAHPTHALKEFNRTRAPIQPNRQHGAGCPASLPDSPYRWQILNALDPGAGIADIVEAHGLIPHQLSRFLAKAAGSDDPLQLPRLKRLYLRF